MRIQTRVSSVGMLYPAGWEISAQSVSVRYAQCAQRNARSVSAAMQPSIRASNATMADTARMIPKNPARHTPHALRASAMGRMLPMGLPGPAPMKRREHV